MKYNLAIVLVHPKEENSKGDITRMGKVHGTIEEPLAQVSDILKIVHDTIVNNPGKFINIQISPLNH